MTEAEIMREVAPARSKQRRVGPNRSRVSRVGSIEASGSGRPIGCSPGCAEIAGARSQARAEVLSDVFPAARGRLLAFRCAELAQCAHSPFDRVAGSRTDRREAAACEKISESRISAIPIPLDVDREEYQVHVAHGVGAIERFEGRVPIA